MKNKWRVWRVTWSLIIIGLVIGLTGCPAKNQPTVEQAPPAVVEQSTPAVAEQTPPGVESADSVSNSIANSCQPVNNPNLVKFIQIIDERIREREIMDIGFCEAFFKAPSKEIFGEELL